MSRFLKPIKIKELKGVTDAYDRPLYETIGELRFEVGADGSGMMIVVPAGRVTNLGSVPPTPILSLLYRGIIRPDGEYVSAVILHDYLCNEQFPGFELDHDSGFSRFEADAFLRSALKALDAPYWQRLTVYLAVRAWAVWSRRND